MIAATDHFAAHRESTKAAGLVDAQGRPLSAAPRRERAPLTPGRHLGPVRGTYDAARTTDNFGNYWANADNYDADSANSRAVREVLVPRSRYEFANNGYAAGIAKTYATDLVGRGPRLQMQTGSPAFNALVESAWIRWTRAIKFRRKLWCLTLAKIRDGEGFGIIRQNLRVAAEVLIDWVLIETEQVQTPALPLFGDAGYVDGIRFDEFGNPLWYDVLKQHPGATGATSALAAFDQTPERIPAPFVTHWFELTRPGQHRQVPELAPTMNTGAGGRRFREATILAAETAADYCVLLSSTLSPDEDNLPDPLSTLDVATGQMAVLPDGYTASQMRAEHPTSTYESFTKSTIAEQARPKSMPLNKAMCDSSGYNYASGRLDHQTYYATIDVERLDCEDLVLEPIFDAWFAEAVKVNNWLTGDVRTIGPRARAHSWAWPAHFIADEKSAATATKTNLESGAVSLVEIIHSNGGDLADRIRAEAAAFGVDEAEIRRRLLEKVYGTSPAVPQINQQGPAQDGEDTAQTADE